MTVEGMQRAHPRPKNVSSPFTLRVCFSDPVAAMVVDSEESRETLIIVDRSRTHSSKEYVAGRLSNLREIQPGQIWLVDVTADETGEHGLVLLGSLRRFTTLDGTQDDTYSSHHIFWVTVTPGSRATAAGTRAPSLTTGMPWSTRGRRRTAVADRCHGRRRSTAGRRPLRVILTSGETFAEPPT